MQKILCWSEKIQTILDFDPAEEDEADDFDFYRLQQQDQKKYTLAKKKDNLAQKKKGANELKTRIGEAKSCTLPFNNAGPAQTRRMQILKKS